MPWKNNSNNTDMKPIDAPRLQAYLDGELTSAETAAVEQHLAQCATSRQRLEQLRQRAELTRRLLNTPDVPIPAFTKKTVKRRHVRYMPWIISAAACLAGAVWLLQPFKADDSAPSSLYFYQEPAEIDANRPYTEQATNVLLISQETR
jgi:hypothetical protein